MRSADKVKPKAADTLDHPHDGALVTAAVKRRVQLKRENVAGSIYRITRNGTAPALRGELR